MSRLRLFRTDVSSSTTNTTAAGSVIWTSLRIDGQGELERRAPGRVIGGAKLAPMGSDDRASDGQAHAKPLRLRGVERLEQPVELVHVDPGAGVLDGDDDRLAVD